jgi:hypothetical protein
MREESFKFNHDKQEASRASKNKSPSRTTSRRATQPTQAHSELTDNDHDPDASDRDQIQRSHPGMNATRQKLAADNRQPVRAHKPHEVRGRR